MRSYELCDLWDAYRFDTWEAVGLGLAAWLIPLPFFLALFEALV